MGSDDGDNGAVTLDQADTLPQGRRVIGFACEAGEGGPGQREETQDLGNKQRPHHTFQFDKKNNNHTEFWPGGRMHFPLISPHFSFFSIFISNNNVLFGAFNFNLCALSYNCGSG